MVYGTPWPLSEDDYLCVYDPQAKNHGIYWIDRDGNRELIYRDPAIACHEPDSAAAAADAAGDSRRRRTQTAERASAGGEPPGDGRRDERLRQRFRLAGRTRRSTRCG